MRNRILVGVGPQGQVTVEAIDFPDASCLTETALYEEAIGCVKNRVMKSQASRKARVTVETKPIPAGYCG